jgi:nitrogen fixation protein NifU and related proteins
MSNEELRALYHETIMRHARNPQHYGHLADANYTRSGKNSSCGDTMEFSFSFREGRVHAAAFESEGCAVSTASASLLTAFIIEKTAVEAALLCRNLLEAGADAEAFMDLHPEFACLLPALKIPTRRTCVHLAWEIVRDALLEQGVSY